MAKKQAARKKAYTRKVCNVKDEYSFIKKLIKMEKELVTTQRVRGRHKIQFRSNLCAIGNLISKVKLREGHILALKRTPFWWIFDAFISNKLHSNATRKCDDNVIEVLRCFDVRTKRFLIGGKQVPFVSNDISVIFGIPTGHEEISFSPTTNPLTPFVLRRFRGEKRISRPVIEKEIVKVARGNRVVDFEDLARLMMLHLCVTLFFPIKGHTIGWSIFKYVEDLDKTKEYKWPEVIWMTLMSSIEEKICNPKDVTGCVITLLFWLCEHVTIIELDRKYNCPRFVKWHLGKLSLALKNKAIRLTATNEVNEGELKLNETESDVFGNNGKKCVELGDNEISPNVKENRSDKNMSYDDFMEEGDEENVENLDEHLGIFSLKLNLGDDLESGRDTDGEQQCKMQPETRKEYVSKKEIDECNKTDMDLSKAQIVELAHNGAYMLHKYNS